MKNRKPLTRNQLLIMFGEHPEFMVDSYITMLQAAEVLEKIKAEKPVIDFINKLFNKDPDEDLSLPFEVKLSQLINKYSKENESNTPDFILAQYMSECLAAFNKASLAREKWYGKSSTNEELIENK